MKNFAKIIKNTDWLLVFFVFIASLTVFTALSYTLHSLNPVALILSILSSLLSSGLAVVYLKANKIKDDEGSKELIRKTLEKKCWGKKISNLLGLLLPGIFIILSFIQLFLAIFDNSLISPWQEVSPTFFILYGLSLVSLLFFLSKKNTNNIKKLYLISFYFLSFSVCLITYKYGYGFDPFIHQATMEFISQNGFILPKTPYYIGQYGLIIALSKLSGLSIYFINKIIVPFLAALIIPLVAWRYLKISDKEQSQKSWALSILSILLIGFSPFIFSTPQNLSYIFLIATVFLSVSTFSLWLPFLLALATLAVHPLSGLPALGFILFILYKKYKDRIKNRLLKALSLVAVISFNSLILPCALFIGGGEKIDLNGLIIATKTFFYNILSIDPSKDQSLLLNTSNFIAQNLATIITIIIISSLVFFYKKTLKNLAKSLNYYFKALILSIYTLFLSYFITSMIVFKEVIAYEQSDYSKRILFLIVIFSLPLIINLINNLIKKILKKNLASKIIWLFFLLILIISSLYNSYPRIDKYHNSKGYNTGRSDLEAVKQIEEQSESKYLVLANQQVSAAALKVFGFDRYLENNNTEIYFYPIPTGGELYKHYLQAVYDSPRQENLKKAMDLAQVNEAYLVINKYWHRSAELINEAKVEANSYWAVNNEVFVFKYLR